MNEDPEVQALTDEEFERELLRMGVLHPKPKPKRMSRRAKRRAMKFINDLRRQA